MTKNRMVKINKQAMHDIDPQLAKTSEIEQTNTEMSESSKFQTDLTKGSIIGQLARFAWPFLLSMLIQQSYSMADLLMVGYFVLPNEAAVTAVNVGGQIMFFAVAIAIGLSVGGTVLVGQYYGAKQMEDATKTAATTLTVMILTSLALGAMLLLLGGSIFRLMKIPSQESFDQGLTYMRICIIGMPFVFVYNAVSGIMRGLGDAKRPLIIVAISCGVNIAINALLMGYFKMGVAGAAIGTIISQIGTVIMASIYLAKSGFFFDFRLKSFVIHKEKLRHILRLGIPSGISQIAVNFSFLLLSGLVNSYSNDSISAAVGLAGRFNGFIILPLMAISNSVSMICAQNLGAQKPERAIRTMLSGLAMTIVIGIPCCLLVRAFPREIMWLLNKEPSIIEPGVVYLRAIAWDYALVPFVFCFFGLATGAGHTHVTMINTFITSVGLRIPAALLLSRYFDMGLEGIGLSVPVATTGGLFFLTYYVLRGKWRNAVIHRV